MGLKSEKHPGKAYIRANESKTLLGKTPEYQYMPPLICWTGQIEMEGAVMYTVYEMMTDLRSDRILMFVAM